MGRKKRVGQKKIILEIGCPHCDGAGYIDGGVASHLCGLCKGKKRVLLIATHYRLKRLSIDEP